MSGPYHRTFALCTFLQGEDQGLRAAERVLPGDDKDGGFHTGISGIRLERRFFVLFFCHAEQHTGS